MPLAKPSNVNSHVLSQFKLDGKVSAVTGGARGIGLEVVRALAEAGATVALIYTSSNDAEATAQKVSLETGQKVVAYQSDVRDKTSITATINKIAEEFGRLDICVANAGIASHHDSLQYTSDQWSEVMKVNLDGAMYTAQAAGNIFKSQVARGGSPGSMIFTASVSALLVNVPQRQAAYNASKAGVVHLAKCLAVEWVDFARVNSISPGFIETDMLAVHPKEWRDHWSLLVPAGRNADAAELKGVCIHSSVPWCWTSLPAYGSHHRHMSSSRVMPRRI